MSHEHFVKTRDKRSVVGAPLWDLYHGTSTSSLKAILQENRLLKAATENGEKISLTPDRGAANFFAHLAALRDQNSDPEARPAVLWIDGDGLIARHYRLQCYSDTQFGEGLSDWEHETACWQDIEDLDQVLLDVQVYDHKPIWADVFDPRRTRNLRPISLGHDFSMDWERSSFSAISASSTEAIQPQS